MNRFVIPHQPLQEVRQGRIKLLHRPERAVITNLELLAPTKKAGDDFADYCAKRQAILHQRTHLVEMDLLLSGRRLPLSSPLPKGDYSALVSRSDMSPDCEVYAWSMRQPLPTIRIPLRKPDADLSIPLQEVFQQAFERGRYARSLPYRKPPRVSVSEEARRWIVKQELK